METKDIKTLMELFSKLPINEMKFDSGEQTLFLAKNNAPGLLPTEYPASVGAATVPTMAQQTPVEAVDLDLCYVTSPIVGTFYAAPNPKAEPYIKEGDRFSEGQVLCIVEAMKLMNEIQSEYSGIIQQVLVQNAQPVEYGQKLFSFKK